MFRFASPSSPKFLIILYVITLVLVFTSVRSVHGICVWQDGEGHGYRLDCGFKKTGLFRFRNLGGLKGWAGAGFTVGDEVGFENSLTNVDSKHHKQQQQQHHQSRQHPQQQQLSLQNSRITGEQTAQQYQLLNQLRQISQQQQQQQQQKSQSGRLGLPVPVSVSVSSGNPPYLGGIAVHKRSTADNWKWPFSIFSKGQRSPPPPPPLNLHQARFQKYSTPTTTWTRMPTPNNVNGYSKRQGVGVWKNGGQVNANYVPYHSERPLKNEQRPFSLPKRPQYLNPNGNHYNNKYSISSVNNAQEPQIQLPRVPKIQPLQHTPVDARSALLGLGPEKVEDPPPPVPVPVMAGYSSNIFPDVYFQIAKDVFKLHKKLGAGKTEAGHRGSNFKGDGEQLSQESAPANSKGLSKKLKLKQTTFTKNDKDNHRIISTLEPIIKSAKTGNKKTPTVETSFNQNHRTFSTPSVSLTKNSSTLFRNPPESGGQDFSTFVRLDSTESAVLINKTKSYNSQFYSHYLNNTGSPFAEVKDVNSKADEGDIDVTKPPHVASTFSYSPTTYFESKSKLESPPSSPSPPPIKTTIPLGKMGTFTSLYHPQEKIPGSPVPVPGPSNLREESTVSDETIILTGTGISDQFQNLGNNVANSTVKNILAFSSKEKNDRFGDSLDFVANNYYDRYLVNTKISGVDWLNWTSQSPSNKESEGFINKEKAVFVAQANYKPPVLGFVSRVPQVEGSQSNISTHRYPSNTHHHLSKSEQTDQIVSYPVQNVGKYKQNSSDKFQNMMASPSMILMSTSETGQIKPTTASTSIQRQRQRRPVSLAIRPYLEPGKSTQMNYFPLPPPQLKSSPMPLGQSSQQFNNFQLPPRNNLPPVPPSHYPTRYGHGPFPNPASNKYSERPGQNNPTLILKPLHPPKLQQQFPNQPLNQYHYQYQYQQPQSQQNSAFYPRGGITSSNKYSKRILPIPMPIPISQPSSPVPATLIPVRHMIPGFHHRSQFMSHSAPNYNEIHAAQKLHRYVQNQDQHSPPPPNYIPRPEHRPWVPTGPSTKRVRPTAPEYIDLYTPASSTLKLRPVVSEKDSILNALETLSKVNTGVMKSIVHEKISGKNSGAGTGTGTGRRPRPRTTMLPPYLEKFVSELEPQSFPSSRHSHSSTVPQLTGQQNTATASALPIIRNEQNEQLLFKTLSQIASQLKTPSVLSTNRSYSPAQMKTFTKLLALNRIDETFKQYQTPEPGREPELENSFVKENNLGPSTTETETDVNPLKLQELNRFLTAMASGTGTGNGNGNQLPSNLFQHKFNGGGVQTQIQPTSSNSDALQQLQLQSVPNRNRNRQSDGVNNLNSVHNLFYGVNEPNRFTVIERSPYSSASGALDIKNAPKSFYPGDSELMFESRKNNLGTNFLCENQEYFPGLYADPSLSCKVFHLCAKLGKDNYVRKTFQCPYETAFDQEVLKCNWSIYVDCAEAENKYYFNKFLSQSFQFLKILRDYSSNSNTGTGIPLVSVG